MAEIILIGGVYNADNLQTVTELFSPGREVTEVTMDRILEQLVETPERNVYLWLLEATFDITAPQAWWKQIEQYGIDVFPLRRVQGAGGSRKLLTEDDFDGGIAKETLTVLNNYIRDGNPQTALRYLPVNFLSRCLAKITYKTLNEIYCDRGRLSGSTWELFLGYLESLPLKELIERC